MAEYVINQGWLTTSNPGSQPNNTGGIGFKYQIKYITGEGYRVYYKLYAWYGINTGSRYWLTSASGANGTQNRPKTYGWIYLQEKNTNTTILSIPLANIYYPDYGGLCQMQDNSPPNIWYPVRAASNALEGASAPYTNMLGNAVEGISQVFSTSSIILQFSSDSQARLRYNTDYNDIINTFTKTTSSIALPSWPYGSYTAASFPGLGQDEIIYQNKFNALKQAVINEVNRRSQIISEDTGRKYTFNSYNTTLPNQYDKITYQIVNGVIDPLQEINNTNPAIGDVTQNTIINELDNAIVKITDFRNRPPYGWDSGCNNSCIGLCQGCTAGCYNTCSSDCDITCTNGCTGSSTGSSGSNSCNSCGATCTAGSWKDNKGPGCSSCNGTCDGDCYKECWSSCALGCSKNCVTGCQWVCGAGSKSEA